MGRINIRGGSQLRIDFEVDTGKPAPNNTESAPKDFKVKLVERGNAYWVVRENNNEELKTKAGNAANMTATVPGGPGKTDVVVEYAEKP